MRKYGIALDIGTTTIAGSLVQLEKALAIEHCLTPSNVHTISTLTLPNPQTAFGSDVISRIDAIGKNPALLKELNSLVIEASNEIISGLLKTNRIKAKEVREVAVAGNSVMEHIFLSISPVSMGSIPYKPLFKKAKYMQAEDVGLNLPQPVGLYLFPLIGAFVGGDAVAVMLALNLMGKQGVLAIDIGTNSEIILATRKGLFVTSAAAGPAFEGGNISSGMSAIRGAISGVTILDAEVRLDVIGGVTPKGICGSGIVDSIAELLKNGIIDFNGRIKHKGEVTTILAAGIKETPQGNSFILFKGAKNEVAISQEDVRSLQTAKAAIRAGVETVLKKAGMESGDVKNVFIAGAFGSSIKERTLIAIGLLDKKWRGRIISEGDAALDGAKLALLKDERKKEAEDIAEKARYVPLSGSPVFEQEFIKNMNFAV